ncbi:MAG TPA: arginine--tRNA ligase, partial [Puia sp.]|nr:arginine--tRNA ligase [Puia sp.]
MEILNQVKTCMQQVMQDKYELKIEAKDILVNETKPEFEGDYTIVLFSFVKPLKKSPEGLGKELGEALLEKYPGLFSKFNVIKGFLNLSFPDAVWIDFLKKHHADANFGSRERNGQKVMVEYSSPNTNKPLHLGHLRNNFLGWSVAAIHQVNGYDTVKTCIAND